MHNPERRHYIGHAEFTPYNQHLHGYGDHISCTGGYYPHGGPAGGPDFRAIETNGKLDNIALEIESMRTILEEFFKAIAIGVVALEDAVEKLLADRQKG